MDTTTTAVTPADIMTVPMPIVSGGSTEVSRSNMPMMPGESGEPANGTPSPIIDNFIVRGAWSQAIAP